MEKQKLLIFMSLITAIKGDIDTCEGEKKKDSCEEFENNNNEKYADEVGEIGLIVDLERYPIHTTGTKYNMLVEDCKRQLRKVGSVDLDGFIRQDIIERMAEEVDNLPSYNRLNIVSPYGAAIDDEPEIINTTTKKNRPHPSNHKFAQDTNAVAFDQIPINSLIRKVYDSHMVMDFIADATSKENMYHFKDEFQAINIMYMYDGCSRAWHYDGSDTVITLLLRKADAGGEFEFAPFIRGEEKGDEKFDDVAELFNGSYEGNIVKNADAGTLNLFNGIRSLHRVRAVYGPTKRIVAVLSYDSQPNRSGSYKKNIALYGERVENIYRERGVLPDVRI